MSSYTLSNNAADIDAAISSVVGADATPTDGSQNMVTSGGVKTYVDGTVGVFGGKTITTEATGIGNTDNDTSIPTSAAVKDYADQFGPAYVDHNFVLSAGVEHSFSSSLRTLFTAVVPVAGYYNRFGSFRIATWSHNNNNPYTLIGVLSVNGTTIYSGTGTFNYQSFSSRINPPSAIYLPAGNLSFSIATSGAQYSYNGNFIWQSVFQTYDGPTTRYVKVG